ncbi:MAG: hypothetical protein OEZ32_08135 [Nitrospinota bacterium]|nr:hypothetical protein [Nitrospinota bacterium]
MYQITNNGVIRISDGASIPNAPGNKDWREYEQWVAEGGTPRPAPPPELRVPVWGGTQWTEGEDSAESVARAARNSARARLRLDIENPSLRGGMPELGNKVQDLVKILDHMKALEDE